MCKRQAAATHNLSDDRLSALGRCDSFTITFSILVPTNFRLDGTGSFKTSVAACTALLTANCEAVGCLVASEQVSFRPAPGNSFFPLNHIPHA